MRGQYRGWLLALLPWAKRSSQPEVAVHKAVGPVGVVAALLELVWVRSGGEGELQPGRIGAQVGDQHAIGVGAGQQELGRYIPLLATAGSEHGCAAGAV